MRVLEDVHISAPRFPAAEFTEVYELDDALGFSLRKTFKRVVKKVQAPFKRYRKKAKKHFRRRVRQLKDPIGFLKKRAESAQKHIRRRVEQIKDPVGTFKKAVGSARRHVKRGAKSVGRYVKRAAKSVGTRLKKHPHLALAIPGLGIALFGAIKARKDPRWGMVIPGVGPIIGLALIDQELGIPVMATVAQAVNLVIPGLGVAIGAAIMTTTKLLAVQEAKKIAEKQKKLDAAEEAAWAAEEQRLGDQAMKEALEAYIVGETYFTVRFGVTREEFEAMDLDDRIRTLDRAIYDMNRDDFNKIGVTEEQFLSMGIGEQEKVLALLPAAQLDPNAYLMTEDGQELIKAHGDPELIKQYVDPYEKTIAPLYRPDEVPWTTLAIIGGSVLVIGFTLYMISRR